MRKLAGILGHLRRLAAAQHGCVLATGDLFRQLFTLNFPLAIACKPDFALEQRQLHLDVDLPALLRPRKPLATWHPDSQRLTTANEAGGGLACCMA